MLFTLFDEAAEIIKMRSKSLALGAQRKSFEYFISEFHSYNMINIVHTYRNEVCKKPQESLPLSLMKIFILRPD